LYSTPEARLDTILGDATFWRKMQRARSTEGAEACTTTAGMIAWFRDTYGIQLMQSNDTIDAIASTVSIVDEKKYLVFLLKYT
jgi:hypothetical protein